MGRRKAPDFGEFWQAYPVHKARADAERAWGRLKAVDREAALAGIPAYREECLRTGVAFCYAQKYLSRRRWEDEDAAVQAAPPPCPADGDLEGMETW